MPSTSDALRELMAKWFREDETGRLGTDGQVLSFLESHGFREIAGLIKPPVPAHNLSTIEWFCIRYMVEEWDYCFSGTQDITIKD